MDKVTLLLSLMIVSLTTAFGATVSLPDSGTYYYWIRGASGSVEQPPHKSSGSTTISLGKSQPAQGTLYVLDPHTGGIAAVPLSLTATSVTIDEFHVPASAAVQASPDSSAAPATQPAPKLTNSDDQHSGPSIVTTLLGLVVLGGVVWFARKIYLSRGQLLIDAARKAGIEVPNPTDPIPGAVTVEGKYEPPVVPKVQRIPDSAFKAAAAAPSYGYLITADGTSHGIGRKPLTIGRDSDNDIVLNDNSVSRHHARVELVGGIVQLVDQNSSNGVFVNGEQVQTAELQPGSRLTIGHVPVRYER